MDIKYFGKYNENGVYEGFYTTDIWEEENIPKGCIELTQSQWKEALSAECRVVDGVHVTVIKTQQEIEDSLYSRLRRVRNKLLSESDWAILPDSPIDELKKDEWINYRQELRDLPSTVDINNIVYPIKPE